MYRILAFAFLIPFTLTTSVRAQSLSGNQKAYLSQHAIEIPVDTVYGSGDWAPVLQQVGDKNIVLIGEFNHGAGEVFRLRNDLIKALHEQLGFDVILFEAGIGELIHLDKNKAELSPGELTNGFFGIWKNLEFRELMEYVRAKDIDFAGYDIQKSSRTFNSFLREESERISKGDSFYMGDIEDRFNKIDGLLDNRSANLDTLKHWVQDLMAEYRNMGDMWSKNDEDPTGNWVRRVTHNRADYLQYCIDFVFDNDWRKRWAARDRGMANNVEWLLEHKYKGRKVIIVGHNFHTARYNEHEEVMGEFLLPSWGDTMYSIATFAGGGTYFDNSGNEKTMKPPSEEQLDIKHVIKSLDSKVHFVSVPSKPEQGNEWLFEDIVVNDSFIDLNSSKTLILSKSFDAILLLDKVSPPTK